jgi:hypothetical protein
MKITFDIHAVEKTAQSQCEPNGDLKSVSPVKRAPDAIQAGKEKKKSLRRL